MAGLFGSSILEVALGMVFVYSILSLISSHINEILAGLLRLRAQDLEKGIQNLLCDPGTAEGVMNNPLIKAMGSTRAETRIIRFMSRMRGVPERAGKPEYIASNTFVQALFEHLAPAEDGPVTMERLMRQARDLMDTSLNNTLKTRVDELITSMPASSGWLDWLRGLLPNSNQRVKKNLDKLKKALDANQTSEEIQRTISKMPRIDMRQELLQLSQSFESADGKRSIGRAMLSLLHQSASAQTMLVTVSDVRSLIDQLGDPHKQLAGLIADKNGIGEIRATVAALPASDLRATVLDFIDQGRPTADAIRKLVETLPKLSGYDALAAIVKSGETLDDIRKALLPFPESDLRKAVLAFIDQGQSDLEAARKNVEIWYDNAMERVSGVYKRRVQAWLLGIALGLVFFTGADSLKIIRTLSSNTDLRTALAARASATAANGASDLPGASAVASSTTVTTTVATNDITTTKTTITTAISNTNALLGLLGEFNQLFGYNRLGNSINVLLNGQNRLADNTTCRQTAGWWLQGECWTTIDWWTGIGWLLWKIGGLVITVIAISLGAPFWFDLLQRISNIRTAGQRPEKSETKSAKQ